MRVWKPALALLFFIAILLYLMGHWKTSLQENFQTLDIQKMLNEIQKASGLLGKQNAYPTWVGWLYAHIESSGPPLNDFKNRVFDPNCKFRRDWSINLPPGMTRPIPAGNKDLANIAYRTYLSCLAEGNKVCVEQLIDAQRRFMEPSCNILRPEDPSSYTKNIPEVFV